ncbi:YggT family protein [Dehalococcoidia bacterium]|nr:YggT family protein [Dehalococcoidia bacterium]
MINAIGTFLYLAIFARVILSWFPQASSSNPLVQFIYAMTEPVLRPIRRFVPKFGMLDVSPMIALILIIIIQRVLGAALS